FLFDFDGTLADSFASITLSVNHVRALHHLPPLPEVLVKTLVGNGSLRLMADAIPGGDPQADVVPYQAHQPTVMYDHTRLLPGVAQALTHLHRTRIKLGICSNKPAALTRGLVDAFGLTRLFDAAFGPEDAGKPKPDPAMLRIAMQKLGVSATET